MFPQILQKVADVHANDSKLSHGVTIAMNWR